MAPSLTGLFLGAGASYEVGIQLVWELTDELKKWLTPEHLRELNAGWRTQHRGGVGSHPDEVIEDFNSARSIAALHYEALLGHLEVQFRRSTNHRDEYHHLYSWLVEIVYWLLYLRHTKNTTAIGHRLPFLDGIARLADTNTPLWIFSLNHDVIVECLAAAHDLPIFSGFTDGTISLPRRNRKGEKIGELSATVLSADRLARTALEFAPQGTRAINLIKIHGALDVFTFNNGNDVLKLSPLTRTSDGVIEALRAANEELIYVTDGWPGGKVNATNEIAYADDTGEMQFLRRTLLAGAFKFDQHQSQVLPMKFLDLFKVHINQVGRLLCVGYGFGDSHINNVIREWLEHAADRRLEIVSPSPTYPGSMLHLAPQIKLVASGATDYFDCEAGITRTRLEVLEKKVSAWIRTQHNKEESQTAFVTFLREYQDKTLTGLIKLLDELPKTADGDLDIVAVGGTLEELTKSLCKRTGLTVEAMYEAFLERVGIKKA